MVSGTSVAAALTRRSNQVRCRDFRRDASASSRETVQAPRIRWAASMPSKLIWIDTRCLAKNAICSSPRRVPFVSTCSSALRPRGVVARTCSTTRRTSGNSMSGSPPVMKTRTFRWPLDQSRATAASTTGHAIRAGAARLL